ncbi:hypothetical protein [Microbacterium oxydans]|nr:hypothetical protein [Microbacterium oxydans]
MTQPVASDETKRPSATPGRMQVAQPVGTDAEAGRDRADEDAAGIR